MLTDRDFRKLLPATQAELRRVAVHLVRSGKTRIEAAMAIGVNRRLALIGFQGGDCRWCLV